MKARLLVILIAITILGILVSTGCSSSAPVPSVSSSVSGQSAAPAASEKAPAAPAGAVTNQAADKASASGSASSSSSTGGNNDGRMVIRNGDIVIVVKDVPASVDAINKVATNLGGYVGGSSVRRDNDRVYGEITINVPAEKFDDAMGSIRGLAVKVEADNTSTQDVTDEFVDNEARLKTLKITEENTQKLMDRADKMETILAIQRELTNIRSEIEKIQGRQNYIQRRVSVSTIKVRLSTEAAPAPAVAAQARSGFEPGTTAQVAWEMSLNFLTGLATVIITLVFVLWWLIPIALIVWWFVRRHRRNKKAKELALRSQPTIVQATVKPATDKPEEKPQTNPT